MFGLEMGLKLAVLGWSKYWRNRWHALDGVLTMLSLVDLVASRVGDGLQLTFLRVLRLQRALRMLRMIRSFRGTAKVVDAFVGAAKQMGNLLVLLLVPAAFCAHRITALVLLMS